MSQLTEWQKQQLLARSRFIGLRLKTEADIIKVYERSAARVAKEVEALKVVVEQTGKYKLELASKQALANALAQEIKAVQQATSGLMRGAVASAYTDQTKPLYRNLQQALESGGAKLDFVKMQAGFAAFDSAAVEAIWARVGKDGLTTSARIWNHAMHYGEAMSEIVVDGVARGRDVVDVARDLTQYVQQGKHTLAEHYPEMMGRAGRRIPKDVCYEALRLARTELTAAAMEGTYAAGTVNPAYEGVDWVLSEAHTDAFPCECAALAAASPHKKGEEPAVPHPNCLCHVRPRVKDREAFVKEVSAWVKDPASSPGMEKWYKEIYTPMVFPGAGGGLPSVAPVLPSAPYTNLKQSIGSKDWSESEIIERGQVFIEEFSKNNPGIAPYGDDLLNELKKVRGFGPEAPMNWAKGSIKATVDGVETARKYYPTTWWKMAEDAGLNKEPWKAVATKRGYVDIVNRKISVKMGLVKSESTAVHEVGHIVEGFVSKIKKLENDFWDRRTAQEKLVKMSTLFPGDGYEDWEVTKKDKFVHPYVGKYYDGRAWEILSMGMEIVFKDFRSGSRGLDKDFEQFILGLLVSL